MKLKSSEIKIKRNETKVKSNQIKTRGLKSFPWDALVYRSIMVFYLNLEKLIRETGEMCHVMNIDE